MYRRSSRLMSSGYYISDEKSDLSPVTAVSYCENLVKVFKKKARKRKSSSHYRTPARFKNVVSASPELPVAASQCDGLSPSTLRVKGQTPVTKSTVLSGYRSRISSAFFGLMDSVSSQSKKKHPTASGNKACSSHMRKACGLFVVLLILLFCGLVDYQTNSHTTSAILSLRIQALEAQTAKMSQELTSVQLMPSPVPKIMQLHITLNR